jgi:hypothetical protein
MIRCPLKHARIADVERAVRAIVIPPSTQVDLSVVLNKLAAMEAKLNQQPKVVTVAVPAPAILQVVGPDGKEGGCKPTAKKPKPVPCKN